MIRWAGWLIALYGLAHSLGALTVEKAGGHAEAWFTGGLWAEQFSDMTPAGSAYWLSLGSFGIPLMLIGMLILWLNRQGLAPPAFLAWALLAWTTVDAAILLVTPWPITLVACILLLLGIRRPAST
jgi:hypothetical protein